MTTLADRLREGQAGEVTESAPLAAYTSYRVGGPADVLVVPVDIEGVAASVRAANEACVAWAVVGWGSNLIVADEGYDGLVIKLGDAFKFVRVPDLGAPGSAGASEPVLVEVGAATMTNHLVRELHKHGLSGGEFLALVPGTFGGAVAMNAGTHKGSASEVVESVRIVTPEGDVATLANADLGFRYRHADLPVGSIIVDGLVRAQRGGVEAGKQAVREEREYRNRTQPYHEPSAGSVFKNPEGDYAGRLIEAAGLKGTRRGRARISERHANFIVTETEAKAADVLGLMALARHEVRRQFGVELEAEQRLLGFGRATLAALLDELAGVPPRPGGRR